MSKYIFVSGGVISSIGKGVTSASISFLLKQAGYKVAPIKFENYLNVDAGTMNPIEHGDPFLCEDGTEADMDIGTYEKLLDTDMGRDNFVTMGQLYKDLIEKERRFEFEGQCVEPVFHMTKEIISKIDVLATKTKADIVVIELGGTAGEHQNALYYEASRIMTLQTSRDVAHIHVSYVPTPKHIGEPKTKPAQLSVRTLNSMGIQPDILVVRSEEMIDQRRRDRLALFCNMHAEDIFSNPDVPNIYEIPLVLEEQNFTEKLLKKLSLPSKKPNIAPWQTFVKKATSPRKKQITIGIAGKYFATGDYHLKDAYAALYDAIAHAGIYHNVDITVNALNAEKIEHEGPEIAIGAIDGIINPIGWGERGAEGKIQVASYARHTGIPYLGLCYGMQLAVVAYARDMLGWTDANTTENAPTTPHPVVHLIPSQKEIMERRAYGGSMRLGGWEAVVKQNTISDMLYRTHNAYRIPDKRIISERHRHRYEFNDAYATKLEQKGLVIAARSTVEGLVEIIELPKKDHPFYVGIQGHPEYKSRPNDPHPLFIGFIGACMQKPHR